MVIKVLSAPGPVCFPLLASENNNFEINFGKEGNADIVMDSTISLIKRGLPIDMVLLSGLSIVTPDFERKTVILRKGGASDLLSRVIIKKDGLPTELIYSDSMDEIRTLMKEKKADSAVVLSFAGMKGFTLEERARKSGIYVPGSCGATMGNELYLEFRAAYNEGLKKFKENPDETAKIVQEKLPNKFPLEFITGTMLKTTPILEKPENYSKLKEAIINA